MISFAFVANLGAQSLINVDFGVGSASAKAGFAATGQGTNDFWNLYRHYDPKFLPGMPLVHNGALANLKYADRTESKVSVAVTNAAGVWGNATGDPMYDAYIFSQNGSNITVAITGLEAARYHFYLYGHADPDVTGEQNSVFRLQSGTNELGPLTCLGSAGWKSASPWQERYQYVVFRDVPVNAKEPVLIEVAAGPNGIPVLNGLQIISRGTSPPRIIPALAMGASTGMTNLIFKSVRYEGRVTDTEARFAVKLEVESLTTNEISGPLFEGDVAVVAPNIPDGLRIVNAARQYRLVATKPGDYQLDFELVAKIARAEPWNQISFLGPPAAISAVDAQASGAVEMQLLSGTPLNGARKAVSRVQGFLGSDRTLAMRWQSKTTEIARKSLVTVDTQASATVTPTVVKFTTQFNYEILQAGMPRLVIQLPSTHTVTRISGEQIRDWNIEADGDAQKLTVEFIKPAEKTYKLVLHTEQPLADLASLQVPQPMNVERESGSFSVATDDMTLDVDSMSGLRQVNAASGTVAAFRFHGRPFSLNARLKRIEPVLKVADRIGARLEDTRLLVKHAVTLTVEKAGIYSVDFTPQAGFTVSDVKGEGIDDWKVADGRLRINFANRVLGIRQIEVQLEQAQTAFPQQFTVAALRSPAATNETAQIGAGSALGIRLKTGELQGAREIPAQALASRGEELLGYQSEQPDWQVTIAAERLPARIVAEVFNLVTIGDGLVGGSATLRYGLINQGVQDFRVQLPAHWKNVEFTGPNIRRKEIVPNPADTNNALWAITLQDKAWGGYTLVITYDYQFDPQRDTLDLRGAHGMAVERETGSVAVTTAASLKLQPKLVADPLRVIDQSELSETDRALITRPVLLAYRYTGGNFGLAVDVTRHGELPVLEAVADRTQITSVLTEEGQMLTQASFMVKNNEKQYQKFRLPAGAKLWGCYVNNQPVKGELDDEWLAVSLPRGVNRDEAFAVDIVYAQTFGAVKAGAIPRGLQLAAPKTDVPNTYAEWQVFVPPTRRLSAFGGNMAVARGTTYGLRDGFREFTDFYGNILREGGGAVLFLGAVVLFLIAAMARVMRHGLKGVVPVLGVALVLAIMAGMLLPALSKSKARAQRVNSVSNLKQIGLAANVFASDKGRLPVNFEEMKNEIGNDKVLVDTLSQQPFVYVGAGKKAGDSTAILAYSPVEDAGVRVVCFADGSVAQLNGREFAQALQRDSSGAADFAMLAQQQDAVRQQQDRMGGVAGKVDGLAELPARPAMTGVSGGAALAVSAPSTPPTAAGIRSIRIEIPRAGQAYTFTKVLNVTDEALAVSMSVMKFRWFVIWRSVLQFTAFAFGLAIVAFQWQRATRSSLWITIGLALSLGAVMHLLISARILHFVLIAVAPVLLLLLVIWVVRKYWPRREPLAEPSPSPGATGAAPAVTALALAFTLGLLPQLSAKEITNAFSIVSAEYTGKVQENVGQFAVTIQVSTFATNQVVPLFGNDVAIQEFSSGNREARLVREGKLVSVRIGPQGDTRLQMKVAVKLGGDVTKRQLAFDIPPALSSKLALAIDEPEADVEFPSAVAFKRAPGDSQTQVDAILGSGDRVDLQWTPRVKRVTEMAASIFVQNHSLVTFGSGVVNTRSVFDYQVTQGELRQAKIQIPASQRLLRVEGEWIRTWELHDEGGAQVLIVDLVKGVAPGYRLAVETEKILDVLPAQVQAAAPHAMNVIRETGLVGVRSGEELTLTVEGTPELQRVDNTEFLKAYGKGGEVLSAYRFLKPGFQLTARAEPVAAQVEAVVRNAFRVGFDQLTLDTTVDYTIKRAGVFTLRLSLPVDYKVESVTGGSNILHWIEKEQRVLEVTLKQRTAGNYALALHLVRLHKDVPRTLELTGVLPLEAQKLSGFVSVTSDQGIAVKTAKFNALLEIPVSALGESRSSGSGVLAFKHLSTDPANAAWQLALTTEMVESWVRAEVVNVISVAETLLSGRAVIRYDIQNAPAKEFRLRVPATYRNVEILGTNIRRRDQTGEEWRVELQAKERGTYTLTITFEQPRDGKTNSIVDLTGIEALRVERETGAMVIMAKPPLQVVQKSASEQLLKIDARELPDWAGVNVTATSAAAEAPALVYRYLRPGFKLALDAKRFDEAAVLQALIESALLTTVIADDGQMMTEMSLRIRNNGLQHLEIQLPTATRVWSAFVGGQPVRPAERGGKLLLPLERSAQDASIPVQLTYVGLEKFPRGKGAVDLASPQLDVPLKNARWELYLPPDYDYSKFAGSMMHEASAAPIVKVYSSTEYQEQEKASRDARSSEAKSSLGRAKRFLSSGNVKDANEDLKQAIVNAPTDEFSKKEVESLRRELNRAQSSNLIEAQRAYTKENARKFGAQGPSIVADQPAVANEAAKLLDYDAEVAERQWEVLQKAQEVSIAKVQPLRVNLPTRGLRHSFTQVLQTEVNKPMTIQFRAESLNDGGWLKIILNGVAAFLLLWMLTAVAMSRTQKATA